MKCVRYDKVPQRVVQQAKMFLSREAAMFYLDETLLQNFFALKHSDKALILPLMPPKGGTEKNAI